MSRVLFTAWEFPKPSEGFILRDLGWLHREGYDFRVLVRTCGDRGLLERHGVPQDVLIEAGPPGGGVGKARGLPWLLDLLARRHGKSLSAMVNSARGIGCERVHSLFGGLPALAACFISEKKTIPFSSSVHAADVYTVRKAYLGLHSRVDFTTACNHAAAEYLRSYLGEGAPEVFEIRHIFDPAGLPVLESEAGGFIAALGRFVEKKGFDSLLMAVASLPRTRLVLGGSGPLETRLKDIATVQGPGERVTFTGWIEGGLRGLIECHGRPSVVVVPSKQASSGDREGIPNVMLEAWAMGLPVVATRSGSIGEVAEDGVNSLLVPPDDHRALAGAIRRVEEDEGLGSRLGREGRATIEREFPAEKTVRRFADLLWR